MVLLVRLAAVIAGSAVFGLTMVGRELPSAFLTAVGFGFLFGTAFMVGTGYRILIAVARRSAEGNTSTSWSGATAASALLTLAMMQLPLGVTRQSMLLAAFAGAILVAYLGAKTGCLLAGCCHARQHQFSNGFDLRKVELTITSGLLVAWVLCLTFGMPHLAATIGLSGHLGTRYLSRFMRGRMPANWFYSKGTGLEIVPLWFTVLMAVMRMTG